VSEASSDRPVSEASSEGSATGIAVFDFDGTITERDTLVGFLAFIGGRRTLAAALAAQAPRLARGIRSSEHRNAAKEQVLGKMLGGRSHADVVDAGVRYAQLLPRGFRRATLDRIADHRGRGHRLVIVSASLVFYLRPVADDLGFDDVIAVDMEVGSDGLLTGALVGPNVRKAEKAVRLRAWLDARADAPHELWAYGDSDGDEELLAMADHPTWVGRRAKLNP
jgi:phosphatidylglycerophosphatase C